MKTIVIAADLSERSYSALGRAIVPAHEMNSKLHLLYMVDGDLPSHLAADVITPAPCDVLLVRGNHRPSQ